MAALPLAALRATIVRLRMGTSTGETREREDSHAIPVPEVLRAPQPSALNRKRIRLILISIISQ